jgi:IS5 family transposase
MWTSAARNALVLRTTVPMLTSCTVAIPRKGKPGPTRQREEHKPAFGKVVKWRTGSEGRISHLKHGYQWDRSRVDGRGRTAT